MVTIDDDLEELDGQGQSHLAGELWSIEGHEGCDTANMLVGLSNAYPGDEDRILGNSVTMLRFGHAPEGATPYPHCAQVLMEARLAIATND